MCRCRLNQLRLIVTVHRVSEVSRVVKKTHEFKRWPLLGETLLNFQMSDSQEVPLSITPVDKKKNPAKIDGVPEWSTDNSELLALKPSADGLSCLVSAVGPLGTAKVSVKADAKIGEGEEHLFGVIDIEVTAGQATSMEITAGTATEQA